MANGVLLVPSLFFIKGHLVDVSFRQYKSTNYIIKTTNTVYSSDKNVENIAQLIAEVRNYIDLRVRDVQLSFVQKLSRLFSALILGAVLALLLAVAVIFFSFTLVYALVPIVGGEAMGYLVVALLYIVLGIVIYVNRKRWILGPILNLIAGLFLDDSSHSDGK